MSKIHAMPRCIGLPTGPCPVKRNDSTVRIGEGDLMLCHDCDFERHRQWLETRNAASVPQTRSVRSSSSSSTSAKQPVETRSAKAQKIPSGSSSSNSKVPAPVCGSLAAAGDNESVQLPSDDTLCAHCNDVTDDTCLKGDICNDVYHGHCTAIPQDVVSVLLTIASQCGWVCEACRSACRGKLSRMSAAQTKAAEDADFLATSQ